jgi:hypothetical protein
MAVSRPAKHLETPTGGIYASVDAFISELSQTLHAHVEMKSGPAYYVPKTRVRGSTAVMADDSNRATLKPHFGHTLEHLQVLIPCAIVIVDRQAVTACRTVRRTEGVVEAGVDTTEAHRRHGYGRDAVAQWASAASELGLIPCYSALSTNQPSIGLAGSLEMIEYATDFSLYIRRTEGA